MSGLEVHQCGVSLVYVNDKAAERTLENNMGCKEVIGGDLSGFQLSTGAYYLCRRNFLELMEVGRLTPDWFRILVGGTINITEIRGWRKTGRPKQMNPSFTELKTVRCIIHGPELDEIYKIPEMSKSYFVDKPLKSTSSMLGETMKSAKSSKLRDETMEVNPMTEKHEQENLITAANLILMALDSNNTNKTRKILAYLDTILTSMASITVLQDEDNEEDEDLSDIENNSREDHDLET